MSNKVTYLGVTFIQKPDLTFKYIYKGDTYGTIKKIPITDELKETLKDIRVKIIDGTWSGTLEEQEQKQEQDKMQVDQEEQEQEQEQEMVPVIRISKKAKRTGTLATLRTQPPRIPNDATILDTHVTDCDFYVENDLHDLVHDYLDATDRVAHMSMLADVVYGKIKIQLGGGSITVTEPVMVDAPKVELKLSLKLREEPGRKHLDNVFYQLKFYYIGFMYNERSDTFDNLDTRDFMSLKIINPNSLPQVMYNTLLRDCFKTFIKSNSFAGVYPVSSYDVIPSIRDFYERCWKKCTQEQLGGNGKRKRDNTVEAKSNALIWSIVKNMREMLVTQDDDDEGNLFLRAQRRIIDNILSMKYKQYDTDIYNSATLITGAFATNIQKNNSIIRSNIFSKYATQAYENKKDIIDNANSFDVYRENVFCPVASTMDGITEFTTHACFKKEVQETGDADIVLKVTDDNYVRLIREGNNLNVIIAGNGNVFCSKKYQSDGLVAKVIYQKTIEELNIQNTQPAFVTAYSVLVIKSLGDIMQEWTATLKYGGYKGNNITYNDPNNMIEEYDTNGNATRIIISNDRPSATRTLWILYNGVRGRGMSDWNQHINSKVIGGYANSANNYFLFDYSSDTIYCHNEETVLRKDKFVMGLSQNENTVALYFNSTNWFTINTATTSNLPEIFYDILNKLLESSEITVNVTEDVEKSGFKYITKIPKGTKFKLIQAMNNDFMTYPRDFELVDKKDRKITGTKREDVIEKIGNMTQKEKEFTKIINSEIIYQNTGKNFGKFKKTKVVYVKFDPNANIQNMTGGAEQKQETYQDPFTYAIVAIGAFAAMMIGLQK